jgi:putative ABC transport system ATP-binding protein
MQRLLKWFRTSPDAAPTPLRPRAGKPVLKARGLTHSFGEGEARVTALHPLSLDLYGGQVALLMGPSGSGKSTLLAALSGLLRPDGGQVLVLGKDLWALSAKEQEQFRRRHFGFIFQGYNLFPALTARQQIEIILRWGEGTSGREARRRADEMLETLGLGNKVHLRPAQLSGGEKQRVAIGRALIKNPEFCFADEPTSALDWAHGEQVVELLRAAAHERGGTVLIVSHDSRIIPFADRVFSLEDGCLREGEDGFAHPAPGHANGTAGPRFHPGVL